MIYSAIRNGSRSFLVFISRSLTARQYINNVLEPVLLPYLQEHLSSIFQQNNARPDIATLTQRFLEDHDINLLPWSARSLDLSPIKQVWDIIGRRLQDIEHHLPKNICKNFEIKLNLRGMRYHKRKSIT
ncbi:MAG: hypothetical protein GAK29_04524 [Acinetobacter bereziniae]|uniref:Mobile element protein n=1 Tax=Acinetobacter bereziniae TaxID=106648 RepID=A0A833PB10_ACIBZ|nr:MAG: hypothetical protein GAK29_04524 [Acinetobacter bereziniae]